MGRTTLVRPDGSLLEVDDKDVQSFSSLGYRPEGIEEKTSRAIRAAEEARYSSPGQKVATALEGAAAGLTLGGSDYLLDKFGAEDFKRRAEYNPGTRLGSEIGGAILGSLAIPGAGTGRLAGTPTGLVAQGGRGVGALVEGKAARAALTGAVEGAGAGFQQKLSESIITGDPLTAESLYAGIGWGSIYGGAISGVVGGVTGKLETHFANKAAKTKLDSGDLKALTGEAWGPVQSGIADAANQVEKSAKQAVLASVDTVASNQERAAATIQTAMEAKRGYMNEVILSAGKPARAGRAASNAIDEAGDFGAGIKRAVSGEHAAPVTDVASKVTQAQKNAARAFSTMVAEAGAKSPNWAKLETATQRFTNHLKTLEQLTGLAAPEIAPFSAVAEKAGRAAAQEVTELARAGRVLRSFSATPDGFARVTPRQAEHIFGAVDTLVKAPSAELAGVQSGVAESISNLAKQVGIAVEGGPATQLRGVWEALREATRARAERVAKEAAGGGFNRLAGRLGVAAIGAAIGGELGGGIGMVSGGLLGLKAAVLGGVVKGVSKWAPGLNRAVGKANKIVSPRIEPLAVRIDGTMDRQNKSKQELLAARSKELREAAPAVRETLYKAIAPVGMVHQDLGPALHEVGVNQFQFILNKLPRDPGGAFNRLSSLWNPSPMETEKFGRYYRVFQDPVGVMQEMLSGVRVLPEYAEGLREMKPALFGYLRTLMLERLSDPKVMEKLSYSEQVNIGVLLDLPLHSTMTPKFIANQMQMYQERNKKLEMPAQPGAGGGGGRPPGPGASQAQKITEH